MHCSGLICHWYRSDSLSERYQWQIRIQSNADRSKNRP